MTLNRLRWMTMMAAIAFLVCIQALAMVIVMPDLGKPLGHAVSIVGFSAGVIVYSLFVFRQIDRMQAEIVRQNEELAALNAMSRAVAGSLDLA